MALCHLIKRPSGNWYNAFTAVDREYRGRGLSLALKAVALQYAKEEGAPAITTVNHSINASMVTNNRKLGYVPQLEYFNIYKALG